jgi:hypothetical protein
VIAVVAPVSDPRESGFVVVRTEAEVSHPQLNVWLRRGRLEPDVSGNLWLLPNLQDTFQGVAEPTSQVETDDDGNTAQVYRLLSAELRPPGHRRPPPQT